MTNRDRLTKAFREAGKRGLVARQNFSCCGGCASSELGSMATARGKDGVVYYHRQDAERLRPSGRYGRNPGADHVYLGYGSVHDGDAATVDVGNKVCEALARAGLAYEWDGGAATRIKVLLPGGIDGEPAPEPDEIPAGAMPLAGFFDDPRRAALLSLRRGAATGW